MRHKSALKSAKVLLNENLTRKRPQYHKYLSKIALFTVIIILSLISWYGFNLTKTQPKSSLTEEAKTRLLVERNDLSITLYVLEDSEKMKILGAWYLIHNLRNSTTVVYYIPAGVYMRDYLKRTSEFVSTGELKYLGNSVDEKRSIEYTIWQLGNLTGITPDSYIWFDNKSLSGYTKLLGDFKQYSPENFTQRYRSGNIQTKSSFMLNNLLDRFSIFRLVSNHEIYSEIVGGIDTNLEPFNLLNTVLKSKTYLEGSNIYMMDLGQIWATTATVSATGRDINVINYSEVDKRLGEIVKELKGRDIEREQVKIEVYNASEIDGLAGRYARKFENSGIEVVRYENAPNTSDRTYIYVPKPSLYQKSLQLIKQLLFVESVVENSRPSFMTTGDVVVILGKDLSTEVVWK